MTLLKKSVEEIKTELICYLIQAIVKNIASISAWDEAPRQDKFLLREASIEIEFSFNLEGPHKYESC